MNLNKLRYAQKYGPDWEERYYEDFPLIPKGFMLADGSRLKISAFPELYAAIGNAYDGAKPSKDPTTFPIPDLRGHFPSTNHPAKIKPGQAAFIIKVVDNSGLITSGPAPLPVGTVVQYLTSKE